MANKTVAIIGAGYSGVAAIKSCKEYGLKPVCFEQRNNIGGVWQSEGCLSENSSIECQVYDQLISNIWKDTFTFSDCPPGEDIPCQPTRHDVIKHLKQIADRFSLWDHIKFGRKVTDIEKAADYSTTGRYTIKSVDATSGVHCEQETFDAVMICSGMFSKARIPQVPNREKFSGSVIHSGRVWDINNYKDKTVVIVGAGVSGIDFAQRIGPIAKKIYLLHLHGTYLLPFIIGNKPYEWILYDWSLLHDVKKVSILRKVLEQICWDRYDHEALDLKPDYPFGQGPFSLAGDIDQLIYTRKVQPIRATVEEFTEGGVKLTNGNEIMADDVIYSTGYEPNCNFVKAKDVLPEKFHENCWLFMYPRNQEHPTLFTILLHYPIAAPPMQAELMSRAAATIISDPRKLPSKEEMVKIQNSHYKDQMEFNGQIPGYVGYAFMLELSKFIGCYPDIKQIDRINPDLGKLSRNGPILPYHFRLFGPNASWEYAKKAIFTAHSRFSEKTASTTKEFRKKNNIVKKENPLLMAQDTIDFDIF